MAKEKKIQVLDYHAGSIFTLKMGAARSPETLVFLLHHCTASQPRRPRLVLPIYLQQNVTNPSFLTHFMPAC